MRWVAMLTDEYEEVTFMNDVMKGMLLVLMILYVISPIDLCPGPVDDLLIILIGLGARKGIAVVDDE